MRNDKISRRGPEETMENGRMDRRVRKTKKQLRQGLTQLLEKKSIKDITVKELSDLVDINRGTFYLHYKDVFDMVEQIEKEMFENFHSVLDRHPVECLNGKPLPMITDIFRFVKENADMCKVLIGKNGDIAFIDRLKNLVKERCFNDWNELFHKSRNYKYYYYYSFIVSGCIGLLQCWLETGLKESPEHMAALAEQMIMTGVKAIQ